MTAEVFLFRPFESARDQAKRAGVAPKVAIEQVRKAQREGREGHDVAGRMRMLASGVNVSGPFTGDAA